MANYSNYLYASHRTSPFNLHQRAINRIHTRRINDFNSEVEIASTPNRFELVFQVGGCCAFQIRERFPRIFLHHGTVLEGGVYIAEVGEVMEFGW